MKITYTKKVIELANRTVEYIEATFDETDEIWSIPTDPANSDYQAYLAQLEAEETE